MFVIETEAGERVAVADVNAALAFVSADDGRYAVSVTAYADGRSVGRHVLAGRRGEGEHVAGLRAWLDWVTHANHPSGAQTRLVGGWIWVDGRLVADMPTTEAMRWQAVGARVTSLADDDDHDMPMMEVVYE